MAGDSLKRIISRRQSTSYPCALVNARGREIIRLFKASRGDGPAPHQNAAPCSVLVQTQFHFCQTLGPNRGTQLSA
jgi:hypothetical protein